jgi:branched-chain amino acid transport system substrate-binding protein
MHALPVDDFFAKGQVRADGRLLHDFFLAEVKAPSESTGPWDYCKIRRTIPAEEAAQPLAQSKCPFVKL